MTKPDVKAAISAALTESSDESTESTAVAAEATEDKSQDAPDSQGVSNDVEPEPKVVPTEVFGVDLSVLPDDETRQKFIDEFREANKTIGKLQREAAEARKAAETPAPAAPAPAAEPTVEASKLTDEQLAEALGINLELADERDHRDIALTRTILEQQERMERLEKGIQETTSATRWDRSFDSLESKFGKLPEDMTREEVYSWAAEQGITSPEAAYWAAVGPVRATVAQALQAKVIELRTSGKKAATTPRPATSAEVDESKLQSKNVKDGIKEAFEKARQQLGIKLEDG